MKLEKVHRSQIMKDTLGNNEEFGLYPMESVMGVGLEVGVENQIGCME